MQRISKSQLATFIVNHDLVTDCLSQVLSNVGFIFQEKSWKKPIHVFSVVNYFHNAGKTRRKEQDEKDIS